MHERFVKLTIAMFLIILGLQYNILAKEAAPVKKNDISDNSSVQEALNRDRELLKQLLLQSQQRLPNPEVKDVEFEVGDNPIQGSRSAQLIIVQFSDYSCHHCGLFTKETYPEIQKNYIATGKLRYVVIDYPLPDNLPAVRASEAVHCASEQGKFWEMHEEIYFEQESLDDIDSIASSINLDMDKFKACMRSKKYEAIVGKNIALGTNLKIPSVPGFIIGKIDSSNPKKVKGITYIRGAKSFAHFQQEIGKVLAALN